MKTVVEQDPRRLVDKNKVKKCVKHLSEIRREGHLWIRKGSIIKNKI